MGQPILVVCLPQKAHVCGMSAVIPVVQSSGALGPCVSLPSKVVLERDLPSGTGHNEIESTIGSLLFAMMYVNRGVAGQPQSTP